MFNKFKKLTLITIITITSNSFAMQSPLVNAVSGQELDKVKELIKTAPLAELKKALRENANIGRSFNLRANTQKSSISEEIHKELIKAIHAIETQPAVKFIEKSESEESEDEESEEPFNQ